MDGGYKHVIIGTVQYIFLSSVVIVMKKILILKA